MFLLTSKQTLTFFISQGCNLSISFRNYFQEGVKKTGKQTVQCAIERSLKKGNPKARKRDGTKKNKVLFKSLEEKEKNQDREEDFCCYVLILL